MFFFILNPKCPLRNQPWYTKAYRDGFLGYLGTGWISPLIHRLLGSSRGKYIL